jgi:hypothetical protein
MFAFFFCDCNYFFIFADFVLVSLFAEMLFLMFLVGFRSFLFRLLPTLFSCGLLLRAFIHPHLLSVSFESL